MSNCSLRKLPSLYLIRWKVYIIVQNWKIKPLGNLKNFTGNGLWPTLIRQSATFFFFILNTVVWKNSLGLPQTTGFVKFMTASGLSWQWHEWHSEPCTISLERTLTVEISTLHTLRDDTAELRSWRNLQLLCKVVPYSEVRGEPWLKWKKKAIWLQTLF